MNRKNRAAARGARWLDQHNPGWHKKLDFYRLAYDNEHCVLGQVYGDFGVFCRHRFLIPDWEGKKNLFLFAYPGVWAMMAWTLKNGFVMGPIQKNYDRAESQWGAAWRHQIDKRRKADVKKQKEQSQLYVPAEWQQEKVLVHN